MPPQADRPSSASPLRPGSPLRDLEPPQEAVGLPERAREPAPPAQHTAPQTPPTRLFVAFFFLGVLIFLSAMAGIVFWFQGPNPFLKKRLGPYAQGSAAAGDGVQQAAGVAPPGEREVRVFFTTDGLRLHPQTISLSTPLSDPDRLRFALEELLRGPTSDLFRSPAPNGTELRGAYLVDDMAVVDVTGVIRSRRMGGPMAEILCVYAIVNTVMENIPSVRTVRILVDGQTAPILWDQVDLSAPFAADASLVEY
jgi:hypothetical protein